MKNSIKKFPKRVIAVLISLIMVISMAPISLAQDGDRDLTVTRSIDENLTISEDTEIGSNDVWSVAEGVKLTVSDAVLTVKGAIIFNDKSELLTTGSNGSEGALVIQSSGAYITREKVTDGFGEETVRTHYLFGYEKIKDENDRELSLITKLDEKISVKIQAEDAGNVTYTLSTSESADADIIYPFVLKANETLICGANINISAKSDDGALGSFIGEEGSIIKNDSVESAAYLNNISGAEVYNKFTVKEIKDGKETNSFKYVKYKNANGDVEQETYLVKAPEDYLIQSLIINGKAVESELTGSYSISADKPKSVEVTYAQIIYPQLVSAVFPEYALINEDFNATITTNDATKKITINSVDYSDSKYQKTEGNQIIWTIPLKASSTAGQQEFTVSVKEKEGTNTLNRSVDVRNPISISVSASTAGSAYTSGTWAKDDVVFSVAASDGIPESKVYVKAGESDAVVLTSSVFTATKTGTYTFYAADGKNNETEKKTFDVKIDKNAPTLEVTVNPESDEWVNSVDITVRATDNNESGIKEVYYTNGASNTIITIDAEGKATFTIDTDTFNNTDFTFVAKDNVDNSTTVGPKTIKVDKTAPNATVNFKRNNVVYSFIDLITAGLIKVNSNSYTVEVSADDAQSGIAEIKCYLLESNDDQIDGKEAIESAVNKDKLEFSFSEIDAGQYCLYTVVKDKAGNEEIKKLSVDSDGTKVEIIDVNNDNNEWTAYLDGNEISSSENSYANGAFVFNAAASNETKVESLTVSYNSKKSDNALGFAQYVEKDGFVVDGSVLKTQFGIEGTNGEMCPNGKYVFTVKSTDSEEVSYTVIKDAEEPDFEVSVSDADAYRTEKTITITLKSALVSGVDTVTVNGENAVPGENGVYTFTADENKNYEIVVTSQSGLSSSESVTVSKIFKDSPVLNCTGTTPDGNENWYKGETYTISLSVNSENQGSVIYQIKTETGFLTIPDNGDNTATYTIENDVNEEYVFKAIGENGLESDEQSITVKKDSAAPVIGKTQFTGGNLVEKAIDFIRDIIFGNKTIHLTVERVNDNLSGVKKVAVCYKDSNDNYVVIKEETFNNPKTEVESIDFSIEDSYSDLYIMAEDVAGNVIYQSTDTDTVIETDPPVISLSIKEKPLNNGAAIKSYNQNVNVIISVKDDNFNEAKTIITVNGEEVSGLTFNKKDDAYTATYTTTKNGDYTITANSTDKAGNAAEEKQIKFHVDTVDISFDKPTNIKNGIIYIQSDKVAATITANEENFNDQSSITVNDTVVENLTWTSDDAQKVHSATFNLEGEGEYTITATIANSTHAEAAVESYTVVLDKTPPAFNITYSIKNPAKSFINAVTLGLFFDKTVTVTVEAKDDVSGVQILKFNADEEKYTEIEKVKTNTVTETYDIKPQYRGTISVESADFAGNKYNATQTDLTKNIKGIPLEFDAENMSTEVIVDSTPPVISEITGIGDNEHTNKNVDLSFTVTEANFFKEDVTVVVKSKDNQGNESTVEYYGGKIKKDGTEITEDPYNYDPSDSKQFALKFTEESDYTVTVSYTDRSGNEQVEIKTKSFTIDKTEAAIDINFDKIAVNTANGVKYYNGKDFPVTATVTVVDHNFDAAESKVDIYPKNLTGDSINAEKLTISEWKETAKDTYVKTVVFNDEANYTIDVEAVDFAGNSQKNQDKLTLDKTDPTYTIEYNTDPVKAFLNATTLGLFFKNTVKVTVNVSDDVAGVQAVIIATENNKEEHTYGTPKNAYGYTFDIDPQYIGKISVSVTDFAENKSADTSSEDLTKNVTELPDNFDAEKMDAKIVVDEVSPVINVVYDKEAVQTGSKANGSIDYYNSVVTATVEITETYFNPEASKITVIAKDVTYGDELQNTGSKLYEISEWDPADMEHGDSHTATVIFKGDANYTITVETTDHPGNSAQTYTHNLTVDKTVPEIDVTFSTDPVKVFLNAVTLNLFFKDTVTVTVSATDETSGLKSIEFSGKLEDEESINTAISTQTRTYGEKTRSATETFSIEPQYRGTVSVKATDYSSNSYTSTYKDIVKNVDGTEISGYENVAVIVDNKAPVISDITLDSNKGIIEKNVGTGNFAKDSVQASFTVNEANFYKEDVKVVVESEDDQGNRSTVEYFGGKIKKDGAEITEDPYTYTCTASDKKDIYDFTLIFDKENDYYITVSYTDKSDNNEEEVKTKSFTIDETVPVINVEYDPANPVYKDLQTDDSISYYNGKVTATITITEHNFDADNSVITIEATDVNGNDVEVSKLSESAQWEETAKNTYVKTVEFNDDANYIITVTSKDYSENEAADYSNKLTVDATAPEVNVKFIAEPVKALINNLTLGLFFKETVTVTVTATDETSGIQALDFSGKLEIEGSIDTAFEPQNTTYDEKTNTVTETYDIKPQYRGTITAKATDYSTNVYTTTYKDIAKNITGITQTGYEEVEVVVDNTVPVISVEYDKAVVDTGSLENGSIDYYNDEVTATITIDEHNFNADDTIITVTAADVNGESIEITDEMCEISGWNPEGIQNGDEHVATVKFKGDANYSINVKSTDFSGNEADQYNNNLTVDKTAPELTVSDIVFSRVDSETDFNVIRKYEDYKHFYNGQVKVTVTARDATSGVKELTFYTIDNESKEKVEITPAHMEEKNGAVEASFTIDPDFKGNIYAQAEDYSTNKSEGDASDGYTKSEGLVIESIEKHLSIALDLSASIKPDRAPNANGFYNDTFYVRLSINDDYSGIQSIEYKSGAADAVSYNFKNDQTKNKIEYTWFEDVPVTAQINNNNKVLVRLTYVDNAGNPHEVDKEFRFDTYKIDITPPEIDVSFNNNNVFNGKYFNAERVMTVKITELNFRSSDVIFKITKDGQPFNSLIPVAKNWKGSSIEHTVDIVYSADGDYTFDISYTDLAGNKNKGVNYGSSAAPKEFTIDNIDPVINVTYDNNSSLNGNYYKSGRTATITIDEHNFDASKSVVSVTAKTRINGSAENAPAVSGWKHIGGDTYAATVNFGADAFYTLEVVSTDLANRDAAKFNKDEFTVDKTDPEVAVTNVYHQSANNGKTIVPVVTITDTNVNISDITIILLGAKNGEVFRMDKGIVQKQTGGYGDIKDSDTSFVYTFDNIPDDDIYTLTVVTNDMAGNQNKFIKAANNDKNVVELNDNSMMFSVNRIGSTYLLSPSTKQVVTDYYVSESPTLVVTEINADKISNYKIAVGSAGNINAISEGKDFSVSSYNPNEKNAEGNSATWYENTYTILSSNFKNDQDYEVTLSSDDRATNMNSSIKASCEIKFCLDTQTPSSKIMAEGVQDSTKKNITINADKATIRIFVTDSNTDIEKCVIELDGKTLTIKLVDGVYCVYDGANKIGEYNEELNCFILNIQNADTSWDASNHTIKFVAVDKAGHKTEVETYNFTLSTNFWFRFYAKKPLFYGTIAGLAIIIAGIVLLIVMKRRKRDNEEEQF